jgi:hypothetical protein
LLFERRAVSKVVWIVVVVLVVAVVAAAENFAGLSKTQNGTVEIDLHIIEDDPVLQIDHFYSDVIYVPLGENVSLAIQNGDDETRVFTLGQFNINVTIFSGETQRVTLHASSVGNYTFISPITPPSPASNGRKGPCLEGFFEVSQNATLLSTTSTGTGVPPSAAAAAAAANGPVGSCTSVPLTAP